MLKSFAVHLIGGILAALGEYFAFTFFKYNVIAGFFIASIVMIFYYVLAGVFLKNVSFVKTVIFMQVTAFIFRDITAFGDSFKDILMIFHGGSNIWLDTSYFITKGGKWYPFFAFITLFLIFPIFIYIGQGLARKEFSKIKDKAMVIKTVSLHLVLGLVFGICNTLYISVIKNTYAEIALYISACLVGILFIAGGIWLKEESYTGLFVLMFNISVIGSALLVLPMTEKIARPFVGGGIVLLDLGNHIFTDGIISNFIHVLLFIPPLLVILGCFIGRKLIKR